jgi:hypothetical protein
MASRSLSSGAHSRDPLARNDGGDSGNSPLVAALAIPFVTLRQPPGPVEDSGLLRNSPFFQ